VPGGGLSPDGKRWIATRPNFFLPVLLLSNNTTEAPGRPRSAAAPMIRQKIDWPPANLAAGARALLVSHWAVDSDSTVKLIKTTIGTVAIDKSVGRAEALRRSMVAMIDNGQPHEAHPAYWAPFIIVSESGVYAGEARAGLTTSPAPISSARRPARKRMTTSDWRTEVWRQ
jgi:hypothetical protein